MSQPPIVWSHGTAQPHVRIVNNPLETRPNPPPLGAFDRLLRAVIERSVKYRAIALLVAAVWLGFAGQAPLLPFLDSFAHRIGETPNRTYVISLGPVEPAQT